MQLEMILRMWSVLWSYDNVDRMRVADSREEGIYNNGFRDISAGVKPPWDYEYNDYKTTTWIVDT